MVEKTLATVGCVALILLAGGIFAYQQGYTPTPTSFQPPDGKIYIGAWLDGMRTYNDVKSYVTEWKQKTGKGVFLVGTWCDFGPQYNPTKYTDVWQELIREGILGGMVVNWAPYTDWRNTSDTETVKKIANGDYDGYIRSVAEKIKLFPYPIFIRFGSEMSGSWSGYGYDPNIFIQAWRRAHYIFRAVGAKAHWMFTPALQPPGKYPQWYPNRRPWKEYYPGDDYVDWIGMSFHATSMYAMNKTATFNQWMAWGEYLEFATQHNKPFVFAEGGVDRSCTKYNVPLAYQMSYITQFFDFMNTHDRVKSFIWYDLSYVIQNPDLLNAYRQAIATPRYIDKHTPTFRINSLLISPTEVSRGETIRISVDIVNTGDVMTTYTLTLKINGVVEATKEATLAGGESATVTFEVARDVAGTYNVEVDGLTGAFTVRPYLRPAEFQVSDLSISPKEVKVGEAVTITFKITNIGGSEGTYTVVLKVDGRVEATQDVRLAAGASTHVTFKTTKGVVRTYHVEVNRQTGTFAVREVAALPPPPSPLELWLPYIGVAIVATTILAAAALLIRRRKQATSFTSRPAPSCGMTCPIRYPFQRH